jgi:hypothetical protein
MDFIHDQLATGKKLQILTVVEALTLLPCGRRTLQLQG